MRGNDSAAQSLALMFKNVRQRARRASKTGVGRLEIQPLAKHLQR